MKPEVYSVWLMPEAAWARELAAVVGDLAGRFSTPRFTPHLTLIGGRPFDRADLKGRVASALPGTAPIAQPVLDVVIGEAFFRSFYALFAAEGGLLDVKRRIDRAALGSDASEFMPHVSLLYGPVEAGAKAAAAREVRAVLVGRTVRFDRIEIVRSGDQVPIADWEAVEAFPLGG
ncbi:MAG: hypothetical protein EXQ95_15625 [Alphaproteobacteria bacterium]|nr:hypothetical protein [Alphaproteobacteria bacterium]